MNIIRASCDILATCISTRHPCLIVISESGNYHLSVDGIHRSLMVRDGLAIYTIPKGSRRRAIPEEYFS